MNTEALDNNNIIKIIFNSEGCEGAQISEKYKTRSEHKL